ncbi:MAG: sulfatase-like hydrolase/transferase [Bdellovibrionaceae bacterium]|nr:sulfatase-like hydrolase/transferase [Pseudobdellovibrionaceae bacterium]
MTLELHCIHTPFDRLRLFLSTLVLSAAVLMGSSAAAERPPNIVLLITDDQGYGDLGINGNPEIQTPHIDAFAAESVRFDRFYCSSVCTPTRGSLMTGRFNQRTHAQYVGNGRSTLNPEELTIAEILKANGYHTGIYGKWHLGDHYPSRPMDQGFDDSLVLTGGKIFTTPEAGYYNPLLILNGVLGQFPGYCMDIYTDYAMQFMEEHAAEPFFIYLATNTPHDPWDDVPQQYYDLYQGLTDPDPETQETARIYYAMISNIDANFKRLLDKLDELGVADDTIVIYMSDNGQAGPGQKRYTAGLRGGKGGPYENGQRVPFLMRWPNGFSTNKTIDTIAAHIDVLPTLVSAAGIAPPPVALDGRDLMPLILQETPAWPDRTLVMQTHHGDRPKRYQNAAIRTQQWKLITNDDGNTDYATPITPEYQLYDMINDIGETTNLAADFPLIVNELETAYNAWFDDIVASTDFDNRPRFQIGTEFETRAAFTSYSFYTASWESNASNGRFLTDVVTPGLYRITMQYDSPAAGDLPVYFTGQGLYIEETMPNGATEYPFVVDLLPGPMDLRVWRDSGGFQLPDTAFVELIAANDLEAENTAFANGAVTRDATASSGKFVAGGDGFTIRWTVPATAGDYGLVFSVQAPAGDGSLGVFLNNAQIGVLTSNATVWEEQTIPATLLDGNNVVELREAEGSAKLDIDYLTLSFVVPALPGSDSSGRLEAEDGSHNGDEKVEGVASGGLYVSLGSGKSVSWNFDGGPGGGTANLDITFRTAAVNQLRAANVFVNGEFIGNMSDSTKKWTIYSFPGVAIAPGRNVIGVTVINGPVNVDYMDYDFTGEDGEDTLAKRATPLPTTFADWADGHGLPADFEGDEDGDGISNGEEFYFSGDPAKRFASTLEVEPDGAARTLSYTYRRRARVWAGTAFRVEGCDSLTNPLWTGVAGTVIRQEVAPDDPDYLNVTEEITVDALINRFFLRRIVEEGGE